MFSIGDVRNPERPFFIRNQQVVGIGEALLIFPFVKSKSLFQSSIVQLVQTHVLKNFVTL